MYTNDDLATTFLNYYVFDDMCNILIPNVTLLPCDAN